MGDPGGRNVDLILGGMQSAGQAVGAGMQKRADEDEMNRPATDLQSYMLRVANGEDPVDVAIEAKLAREGHPAFAQQGGGRQVDVPVPPGNQAGYGPQAPGGLQSTASALASANPQRSSIGAVSGAMPQRRPSQVPPQEAPQGGMAAPMPQAQQGYMPERQYNPPMPAPKNQRDVRDAYAGLEARAKVQPRGMSFQERAALEGIKGNEGRKTAEVKAQFMQQIAGMKIGSAEKVAFAKMAQDDQEAALKFAFEYDKLKSDEEMIKQRISAFREVSGARMGTDQRIALLNALVGDAKGAEQAATQLLVSLPNMAGTENVRDRVADMVRAARERRENVEAMATSLVKDYGPGGAREPRQAPSPEAAQPKAKEGKTTVTVRQGSRAPKPPPKPGDTAVGSDGKTYTFDGKQWE